LSPSIGIFDNLTPRRVFDLCPPRLDKERRKILKRGADASLKHPSDTNSKQRAPKRDFALLHNHPRPFREKNTKRELKRGKASEYAYREFERDEVPLSPPPPSPYQGEGG
jgi:hypothetical protein